LDAEVAGVPAASYSGGGGGGGDGGFGLDAEMAPASPDPYSTPRRAPPLEPVSPLSHRAAPGRGVIENKHSTDVESTNRVHVSVRASHPERKTCYDLGSSAGSQRPSWQDPVPGSPFEVVAYPGAAAATASVTSVYGAQLASPDSDVLAAVAGRAGQILFSTS